MLHDKFNGAQAATYDCFAGSDEGHHLLLGYGIGRRVGMIGFGLRDADAGQVLQRCEQVQDTAPASLQNLKHQYRLPATTTAPARANDIQTRGVRSSAVTTTGASLREGRR